MECGGGSNLVRGGSAGLWLACGISTGSTGDMECESSAGSLTQDQLRIIGDKSQNPTNNHTTNPNFFIFFFGSWFWGFGGGQEAPRFLRREIVSIQNCETIIFVVQPDFG